MAGASTKIFWVVSGFKHLPLDSPATNWYVSGALKPRMGERETRTWLKVVRARLVRKGTTCGLQLHRRRSGRHSPLLGHQRSLGREGSDTGSEVRTFTAAQINVWVMARAKKRVTWCNMVDSQKQLYSQVVTLKLNTQQCQACNCYTVRHFENHSENHLYWVWESLCIQFKNCKSLLWITLRIAFRNSQRVEHEVKAFKKNPWNISQSGAIWCNLAQDQSFIETGWNWSVLLDTYFESL